MRELAVRCGREPHAAGALIPSPGTAEGACMVVVWAIAVATGRYRVADLFVAVDRFIGPDYLLVVALPT